MLRYALAVLLGVCAIALRAALNPWLGPIIPHHITFVAGVAATVLLGFWPGLVTVVLGIAGVEVLVLGSLPFTLNAPAMERLSASVLVGVFIVWTLHVIRTVTAKAHVDDVRLAAFAAATFEGIVESEGGVIVDCNEQFARMTGRRVDELRGTSIVDLIVPEDRERVAANLRGNREAIVEHGVLRSDGSRVIVEAHGRPAGPGARRRYTAVRDVTERKRAETALDLVARKYAAMFDNTTDGVWIHNLAGEILEINDAYCRMSGYRREELIDMPVSRLEANESAEEIALHIQKLLAGGGHDRFESRHRRKDGTVFDVDVTALYLEADGGRIAIFVRDVSDAKRAADKLRQSAAELQAANASLRDARLAAVSLVEDAVAARERAEDTSDRLSREISERQRAERRNELLSRTASQLLEARSPQVIVDQLCSEVMAFLRCDVFFNFLVDEKAGRLRLNACAGIDESQVRQVEWLDYGVAICGCAARDGCRIVAEDVQHASDPRTELVRSFGVKTYACHPLMAQGRVLGTLSFGARDRPRFTDDELSLMKEVADHVALAFDRQRGETELRESRRKFQALIETTSDFIWEMDASGRYSYCSPQMEKLWGIKPEAMIGKAPFDLMPEEQKTGAKAYFAGVTTSPAPFSGLETSAYVAQGRLIQVETSGVPFFGDGGELLGFRGISRDVTERKRAEEALRETRDYLENLFEHANAPIIVWDPQLRVTRFNRAFERLTGRRAEEAIGERLELLFPEGSRKESLAHIRRAVAGERWEVVEIPIQHADGSVRTVLWNSATILNPDGTSVVATMAQGQDITERKRAEEALAGALGEARRRAEEVAALLTAARAALDHPAFAVSAKRIFGSCRELVGAAGGYVALWGPPDPRLALVCHAPEDPDEPPELSLILAPDGALAEALKERRTVAYGSASVERWNGPLPPSLSATEGALFVPLVVAGQVVGVLNLTGKSGGFGKDDIRLATAFAEMASVALLNSRTLDLLAKNQTVLADLVAERTGQLEEANDSLAAERAQLESVLNTMQESVVILGQDLSVEYINPSAERHFGKVDGRACYTFLHGRRDPCPWCPNEEVFAGKQLRWEWTVPSTGKTFEAFATRLRRADGDFAKMEVFHDVTERKEAEKALRTERARFFGVLDQLPVFVYLAGEDHSVVFANRCFREEFGHAEKRPCYEIAHRRSTPCETCDFGRVFATGHTVEREWTASNGKSYEVHHYPFVESDGTHLLLALGVNVTERKLAYEAEQVARRAADTLRDASLALTRTLDVDTVLLSLLEHLHRLMPFDRAKVMLLDAEGRLVVRAVLDAGGSVQLLPEPRPSFEAADSPVIQQILTTHEATVIDDIHGHPWFGPRADPTFEHSWLGVPLVTRGNCFGMYSVGKRDPGSFTVEHRRLAEALSAQAAVAVENALLFEQVQAASARLQTLSRRLVEVQETERRTIARELHDEAAQLLTSLLFGLRELEKGLADNQPVMAQITELKRTTDTVMEDLHRLATDLRPASLEHLGFVAALRQHLARIESTSGIEVHFMARGLDQGRLSSAVEMTLFRVVQEALTNVLRHADAKHVDVLAERRGGRVTVIVEDDGVGFDTKAAGREGRLGRVGMTERAEALGGTLTVESSPGAGTTVVVEVPYADSSADRG